MKRIAIALVALMGLVLAFPRASLAAEPVKMPPAVKQTAEPPLAAQKIKGRIVHFPRAREKGRRAVAVTAAVVAHPAKTIKKLCDCGCGGNCGAGCSCK